jgi:hypothetical protein
MGFGNLATTVTYLEKTKKAVKSQTEPEASPVSK